MSIMDERRRCSRNANAPWKPLGAAHFERFVRGTSKPSALPEEVWINPPATPTTGGIAHSIAKPGASKSLAGSAAPHEGVRRSEWSVRTLGWKCKRGFERAKDECQSIKVPEHAFLTDYGGSWKCERGFEREDNRCSLK